MSGRVEAATPDQGTVDSAALLRVMLKLGLGYSLVMAVTVAVRAELHHWGYTVEDNGHPTLQRAFIFHAALAALALLGWRRMRNAGPAHRPRRACRGLLMSAPVVLLISADLLVSIEYAPPAAQETYIFMRDPKLHWRFEPGTRGTRGGVPISINAHGLRGPIVSYERRDDEFRILFLGDSTTVACNVPWDDTFAAQVQRLMPRIDGRTVTVINAGVDGYTTWQERLMAEECLRYAPDWVVLGYCPNDLTDYDRNFLVCAGGRYLKHSGIFRAAQRWRFGTRRDEAPGRQRDFKCPGLDELFSVVEPDSVRRAWTESLGDLAEIQALCASNGAGFCLLFVPARLQVARPQEYGERPQRRLAAFAAERGIPFIDPLPRFLSMPEEEAADCYLDYWHWSAKGHRIAAGLLVEELSKAVLTFPRGSASAYQGFPPLSDGGQQPAPCSFTSSQSRPTSGIGGKGGGQTWP